MIIKDYTMTNAKIEEDKIITEHTQLLDPTLEYVQQMRENQASGGFSADRTKRYIGSIPVMIYEKHKEEWKHNRQAMLDWFDTPEGRPYRVNAVDTGKSGKTIVK